MRLILTILFLFFFAGISNAAELTIGLIPEQNVFKQFERYRPLGEYLEKRTGIKINFSVLPRYGNIIESFTQKKIDGAFWGSFTGAMAIQQLGIELVARPVNLDGTSTYSGYIFVRKDSGIRNISEAKGKVIAFVDKATTAGYIFPLAYFRLNGISDINSFFREHYFAGSHDAVIYSVLNGEADIGCAKNTIFDMMAQTDHRVKENLYILARSPDVPSNGLGLRKDISPPVKKQIMAVLLGMDKNPEGKRVLREFGVRRFIVTTKEDYSPVIEMAKRAGINMANYEYFNE